MLKRIYFIFVLFLLIIPFHVGNVGGEETKPIPEQSFDSIGELIDMLKAKGVITGKEAAKFIQRHKGATALGQKKKVIMIIPDEQQKKIKEKITKEVTEQVNKEIQTLRQDLDYNTDDLLRRSRNMDDRVNTLEETITDDIGSKLEKASWAQRIRWGGDIRLRYQADYFDSNNAPLLKPDDPNELMNTTEDRTRYRYRVRVGAKVLVMKKNPELNAGKVEASVALATGNSSDPVSTNDTLGDYENKDSVYLDLANLKWTYSPTETIAGAFPQLVLVGGRMPNPWFSTDLVWDSDLRFEGLALNFKTDTELSNPWTGFLTLGAFPLQEVELSQKDKWLYGTQIGLEYKKAMGLSAKFGIAYYDFENTVGEPNLIGRPNERDFTAPQYQQKGNTLFDIDPTGSIKTALASEYDELNLTAQLDYSYWFPIHITLFGDYVKNLGFNRKDVERRTGVTGVKKAIEGYMVGLRVGHPKMYNFGDWNAFFFYRHVEADAVIDAFTDSDFHLGGTNTKGWILGGEFGLYKNLWLRARWLSSDEIDGPPLAIDTFQLDLISKF